MSRKLLVATLLLALVTSTYSQSFVSIDIKGYPPNSYLFLSQGRLTDEIYHRARGENLQWMGEPLTFNFKEKEDPLQLHITFGAGGQHHAVPLIIFPGDSISVTVDVNDYWRDTELIFCEIKGANAAGQEFLYTHEYYPPINYMDQVSAVLFNEPKELIFEQLVAEYDQQLQPLKDLLAAGEITEQFYNWSRSSVETPLISYTASLLHGKRDVEFDELTLADRQQLVEQIFEKYSPLEPHRLYGRQGTMYAKHYYAYQRAKEIGEEFFMGMPDSIIQWNNKEFVMQDVFPSILRISDKKLREYLFAESLFAYFQVAVGDHSWLENHLQLFHEMFPNSKYQDALAWSHENNANIRQEKMALNHRPAPVAKSSGAPARTVNWTPQILDGQWDLNFLKKGMSDKLSGKDLYIGIWETGCQSCLEDIDHQAQTDRLLASYDIERLYISMDEAENEDDWFNMIFDLQLGGYHLRAAEDLRKQLASELGVLNAEVIAPRYLFVKGGQIIEKSAARPSEPEALQRQLEQYFNDR